MVFNSANMLIKRMLQTPP